VQRAVHPALQHLSDARHFGQATSVEQDPMNRSSRLPPSVRRSRNVAAGHSYALVAVVAAGALAATALLNRHLAKKAEHDNPPEGQFLDVDGVRLHYVERGSGEPLVLLHGNGSMIQDFESSGLVDLAAKNTGSSSSTVRASATAAGHGMSSGHPMPRPS
jgi:hypothetical protein